MLNAELELAHTVLSNIDQHIQVLENNRVTLTRWIERYKREYSVTSSSSNDFSFIDNGGDSSNKKLKLDPFAPKRPLTAYLQWCADNKSHYRSQYPLLNSKELLAHMGQQWTSLDGKTSVSARIRAPTLHTLYTKTLSHIHFCISITTYTHSQYIFLYDTKMS